jgi:hypothetical protein
MDNRIEIHKTETLLNEMLVDVFKMSLPLIQLSEKNLGQDHRNTMVFEQLCGSLKNGQVCALSIRFEEVDLLNAMGQAEGICRL